MAGNTNPYGYIKEGKVYRNAFLDFPEREIGELRDDEATTLKYFEDRFEIAKQKVADLEKAIETSENKGSYLMKLIHLREYLANFDALGDFIPLFEKLDVHEKMLRELIAANRAKNLEIKRALLQEAEKLKDSTNWKETTEAFKELKMKWIKTGSVEEEHREEVEERFKKTIDHFFDRKNAFLDDRRKMIDSRVEDYKAIISEVRKLSEQEDVEAAVERVKELQKKWKTLKEIPHKKQKALWSQLKQYTDHLFARYKGAKRTRNVRSNEETVSIKQDLLNKAEALNDRHDEEAVQEIKRLQGEWKKTGRLPREEAASMNNRFFKACDMVVEKHFLDKIARSKFKGFAEKDEKEQNKLKMSLLRDLLSRDENELLAFQENLEKLNSGENAFNKMLSNKLSMQSRKVAVKKQILQELRNRLKAE